MLLGAHRRAGVILYGGSLFCFSCLFFLLFCSLFFGLWLCRWEAAGKSYFQDVSLGVVDVYHW